MTTPEKDLETGQDVETEGTVTPFVRRAPRISQADVFRAADELLLEGNSPTIDRVRMRLGRGSPNTINDHLDAWWAKLGSRLRDAPGQQFPQLPERVGQALQHLWNEALDGARGTAGRFAHASKRLRSANRRSTSTPGMSRNASRSRQRVPARWRRPWPSPASN